MTKFEEHVAEALLATISDEELEKAPVTWDPGVGLDPVPFRAWVSQTFSPRVAAAIDALAREHAEYVSNEAGNPTLGENDPVFVANLDAARARGLATLRGEE